MCQHRIDLGAGFGGTIPDFFYAGEDQVDPGTCIFLDGMSGHIHGNPEHAEQDAAIRAKLDNLGYQVVVVRSFELDDKAAVVRAVARIAKYLVSREEHRAVKEDTSWFDRVSTAGDGREVSPAMRPEPQVCPLRLVEPTSSEKYVTCLPLMRLKAAAGAFGNPQHVEDDDFQWVAVESRRRLRRGMFVAQVVGRSMEPTIPDGSFCLFAGVISEPRW